MKHNYSSYCYHLLLTMIYWIYIWKKFFTKNGHCYLLILIFRCFSKFLAFLLSSTYRLFCSVEEVSFPRDPRNHPGKLYFLNHEAKICQHPWSRHLLYVPQLKVVPKIHFQIDFSHLYNHCTLVLLHRVFCISHNYFNTYQATKTWDFEDLWQI